MCFYTIVLCGICSSQIGRYFHATCNPQLQQSLGHQIHNRPPSIIYPPTPYACPNQSCIASTELHWALRTRQEAAIQQGEANLHYVPFHEIKTRCNDITEACDLAVAPRYARSARVTDEACDLPIDGYPPRYVRSARVGPEWLSGRQWLRVLEMRSHGKNILEIAEAVDKNASLLRVYIDTYLKHTTIHIVAPLPSASSTDSMDSTTGSDDELFPLDNEVIIPQEGMPHPSFLDRSEQQLVWKMFQKNATVRSMCEQLQKSRRKISQYINAYLRPKLLKLQAEEREAEYRMAGGSTYITPLPNISRTLLEIAPIATSVETLPTLSEPRIHSIDNVELNMEFIETLLHNPKPAVPNHQRPESSGGSAPLEKAESASSEGSLFGDSPVENGASHSLVRLASTHHNEEPAEPPPGKRKHDDHDIQSEPQRASKRLRHRSFP